MKHILTLIAITTLAVFTACNPATKVDDNPTKVVTLETVSLTADNAGPIVGARAKARPSFPEKYKHDIPELFNVYFVDPHDPTNYVEFNNVPEGEHTFEVAAKEYRVVVTNADVRAKTGLDAYSHQLYLYGEETIDFSQTDTGTVNLANDYAAVMIVNNNAVASIPKINGHEFEDVGQYYNIYTRQKGSQEVNFTDIRGGNQRITKTFEPNQVYRFMLSMDSRLIINVEDIFTVTNDETI